MAAKKCLICNCSFSGRSDAKTCSVRCRKRLQLVKLSIATSQLKPKSHSLVKTLMALFVGLLSSFFVLFGSASHTAIAANTSSTLNFQARLLTSSGAVVADGTYNIRFKIYDGGTQGGPSGTGQANSGTGGTYLWTEQYYDSNGVTAGNDNRVSVKNGYFSVNLGSQTAFSGINWDYELWLAILALV